MSLIRKHVAVLQAWACLDLVVLCACVFVVFKGQLLVPLVEPCCPPQSVCHITVTSDVRANIKYIQMYIY